ncbi:3,4-dihydroxy-2-butanone-4-phosphate synthase [Psychromicrobium xiongbiense]|uniref:3,4-dihydroxy-2-butanone-4-phosphate synthase n=1 Tax=Psychromicrobium xiongbiense TaxID=3051184 RepID=UPI0025558659|nr:3,4-dihydroxy-2-butanone-4-phosphate synthase [Psychromicrobium sp. YIM S02556]
MNRTSPSEPVGSGQQEELWGIPEAIAAIARGGAVVVVDDESRENEGDVIFAAEHSTAELMGWTIRHTSGVICVPLDHQHADRLELPPMTEVNQDGKGTAYTVSCDAAQGVSTGISATDRARTARVLADPASIAEDLTRPGHIFPLRAVEGGVRQRPGHTEAAVELAVLAGCQPVAVISEIVRDDGEMMRRAELEVFSREHGCPMISIADLVKYLDRHESSALARSGAHPEVER